MKIAYFINWDIYSNDGLVKKIKSQTDAWRNLGHDVKIFNIQSEVRKSDTTILDAYVLDKKIDNFTEKFLLNPTPLINELHSFNPDIVYTRFNLYVPFYTFLMKRYRTVIELNGDDIAELKLELALHGNKYIKKKWKYWYHMFTRGLLLGSAAGMVSVSHEISALPSIKKYRKPCIVIPNSIMLSDYSILKTQEAGIKIPQLLFMAANELPWHGVDKIIQVAKKTVGKLHFHMIGLEQNHFEHLENVTFYGFLQKEKYQDIIKNCDVAVGTLAFHRNNLNEGSPLKTREYLAYGLPVIIGYKETSFMDSCPHWILQLPNYEGNALDNIEKIIVFCYKMKNFVVPRDEIIEGIDSEILEKKKCTFFETLLCHENLKSKSF